MAHAQTDIHAPERPSVLEVVAYRVAGWKLGHRHPRWVFDDITSGRADRWRAVTCVLLVAGTQLLTYGAFAYRGGGSFSGVIGIAIGAPLGALLGLAVVLRRDRTVRHAKALRYQGLTADGRPEPAARGLARLTNLDIAAVVLFSIGTIGVAAGVVPHLMHPEILGRCVDADPSTSAALEQVVPEGVRLRSVAVVHDVRQSVVSAVLADGRIATWQRFGRQTGALMPVNSPAFAVGSSLPMSGGGAVTYYGAQPSWRQAEACAARRAGLPPPRTAQD